MPQHLKKASIGLVACILFFHFKIYAQSDTHRTETWSVDYTVDRVTHSDGYTMVTGYFNRVGPYSGSGVLASTGSSTVDSAFPKVNGSVFASVPDGSGGWFIGGLFDLIDNVPVKHLAHIKADHKLDTNWKPNVSGFIYAMALEGTNLYIGGSFQSVNNQTRNFLAAFDVSTGSLKNWDPNCSSVVHTILANENMIYIGGNFTTVDGQARNKVAAIDAITGIPTSWNPSVTGTSVLSLAANSSTVFIGGEFTAIDGTSRSGLGAVDAISGALLSWDANAFHAGGVQINSLLLESNNLYVGGKFSSIGGQSIAYLASLDTSTGLANSWNPEVNYIVQVLTLSGTTLFAGGQFSMVDGVIRQCIAAINTGNASLLSFDPSPEGTVRSIAINDDDIFIGGDFSGINWIDRNEFALFKDATDELWPFDIALSSLGYINAIAVKDNILYVGGQFTEVNSQPRLNLAAVNLIDGQVLPWNPSVTDPASASNIAIVSTMEIKDNVLYIGGRFMEVNGQPRESLAAIDLTTAVPTAWHPVVGNGITPDDVYSIDIQGNTLFAAGDFTAVNGENRSSLAAIDLASGNILPWDPQSNDSVWKIRTTSTTAYVVGDFNDIGGTTFDYNIAAIDLSTGNVVDWHPDFQGGYIMDVALTANDVIVAGYYSQVGTEFQNGLASFAQATGALNNWKPDVGTTEGGPLINAVDVSPDRVHVGGSFKNVGDEQRFNYAEYSMCSASPAITLNGSTLTSTTADAYQWYLNDQAIEGATQQTLDILLFEYGVYAVEAVVGGCSGRSNDFVYLITGDEWKENNINIFPNPVVKTFFVEVSERATMNMFDLTGKEVFHAFLLPQQNQVDIQYFPPGIYIIQIKSESGNRYFKIHKKAN